jgi:hypothetical protein
MFYPGQVVYIPEEKRLGIYMGFNNDTKYPYKPYIFVFTILGTNGEESDTQIYDLNEARPIVKPDKKSLTGQAAYKTPFQRTSASKIYFEKEADASKELFITEMNKLLVTKWFNSKYEVNLVVK